jgi:hypothetical protein
MWLRRRTPSNNPGWLREEAGRQVPAVRAPGNPLTAGLQSGRAVAAWYSLLVIGSVILKIRSPTILPEWAPPDPAGALATMWQVHTTFAAVAFAGLALVFQLSVDPPMSPRSVREILYERTMFRLLVEFSGLGSVFLGVAALWFVSDSAVAIGFVGAFAPTIILIAVSYYRAADLFVNPSLALRLAEEGLVVRLMNSMRAMRVLQIANAELARLISQQSPLLQLGQLPAQQGQFIPLLIFPDRRRIADINFAWLYRIAAEIASMAASDVATIEEQPDEPTVEEAIPQPNLSVDYLIDDIVEAGSPVFRLSGVDKLDELVRRRVEIRLAECLRWANA